MSSFVYPDSKTRKWFGVQGMLTQRRRLKMGVIMAERKRMEDKVKVETILQKNQVNKKSGFFDNIKQNVKRFFRGK